MAKSGKYVLHIGGHTFTTHVDVDGNYPQMQVSVNIGSTYPAHWIANVQADGADAWEGAIFYRKDNAATLKVTSNGQITSGDGVVPDTIRAEYLNSTTVRIHLKKSGTGEYWYYEYSKVSDYFREVEVEFDYENGVNQMTSINPHDVDHHRPASLPNETISIASTYLKAGIKINQITSNNNAVATNLAGGNSRWSNNELHDAMQTQWSKGEAAQWAAWMFQANRHEDDHTGIMFDSTGDFQRCGVAIFHGYSGYSGLSSGLVNRHKFHTLVHEMGHCFNLYHSWIKTAGTSNWADSFNEPEARSYMNYPDRVSSGYYGFFDTFEYRFSDQELKFLRHAPEQFVQPGGSAWGHDHAGATMGPSFESTTGDTPETGLQLIVRSNKAQPTYEYLELVNLELKLKNTSTTDQKVPEDLLGDIAHMQISISRNGAPAKVFKPYAVFCGKEDPIITLKPGESIYDSLFLSAGKFGWAISDPGFYQVIVSVHSHTEDGDVNISSAPFVFSVAEPNTFNRQKRKEQEILAQDVFSDAVGRTLAFGGTKVLTGANDVLKELTERFPEAKAAKHAAVALAMPNTRDGYKLMAINNDGSKAITPKKADEKEGVQAIKKALVDDGEAAAETLGNIAFQKMSDKAAKELKAQGDDSGAKQVQQNVLTTMEKRGVTLPKNVKATLEAKAKA